MAIQTSRLLRFAALPVLFALARFLETTRPVPFFQLLNFIVIFVALVVLVSLSRGKLRDGLLVLSALLLGVCIIEGVATFVEPKMRRDMAVELIAPRPILGWGPGGPGIFHDEKRDPETGAPIYSVDYTIGSDLSRRTLSGDGGPAIVFFGDSMTFGQGVNDKDTLPQSFADELGRKQKVLNLAYMGYGPQHFLRALQSGAFDELFARQVRLFVFMTSAWHAERTSCKASWVAPAPRYILSNEQLVFSGECAGGSDVSGKLRLLGKKWCNDTAFCRVFLQPIISRADHDDVELYLRILLAAVELAKEKYGVQTLIPYLPTEGYLPRTGFTDAEIMKRLQDGGALVVDVSLRDEKAKGSIIEIPGDGHPTALANRARASVLRDYLMRHRPEIFLHDEHSAVGGLPSDIGFTER